MHGQTLVLIGSSETLQTGQNPDACWVLLWHLLRRRQPGQEPDGRSDRDRPYGVQGKGKRVHVVAPVLGLVLRSWVLVPEDSLENGGKSVRMGYIERGGTSAECELQERCDALLRPFPAWIFVISGLPLRASGWVLSGNESGQV